MPNQHSQSLRNYNTLALGASAAALVHVDSDEKLLQACSWARQKNMPVLALGEGSNIVLIGEIDALVVRLETCGVTVVDEGREHVLLRVAAGHNWHELVRQTLNRHWYGLENLALIPGTVGAAPVQNIGAYGVELQSVVAAVHTIDVDSATPRVLSAQDCEFAYRDSVFKGRLRDRSIVTAVDMRLSKVPQTRTAYPELASYLAAGEIVNPSPQQVFDAVVAIRQKKLPCPDVQPNAGSFFKNPVMPATQAALLLEQFPQLPTYPVGANRVKIPAAWMIEYCGWKGFKKNGFGVHPQHALVLVNYGNDNGRELLALASAIAASVADTFGVTLEIEPRVYGQ